MRSLSTVKWLSNLVPSLMFLPSSLHLHEQHKPLCTWPLTQPRGSVLVDFNHASYFAVNITLQLPMGDAARDFYGAADSPKARAPTEPQDDPDSSDMEEMEVEEMGEWEGKEMDVD